MLFAPPEGCQHTKVTDCHTATGSTSACAEGFGDISASGVAGLLALEPITPQRRRASMGPNNSRMAERVSSPAGPIVLNLSKGKLRNSSSLNKPMPQAA